jgi:hypothetical protein
MDPSAQAPQAAPPAPHASPATGAPPALKAGLLLLTGVMIGFFSAMALQRAHPANPQLAQAGFGPATASSRALASDDAEQADALPPGHPPIAQYLLPKGHPPLQHPQAGELPPGHPPIGCPYLDGEEGAEDAASEGEIRPIPRGHALFGSEVTGPI